MNLEYSEVFRLDADGAEAVSFLPACCARMEETAGRHADLLGIGMDRLLEQGLAWALARLQVVVRRCPRQGEELRISTWPVAVERLQFRRDFLLRGADGEEFLLAVSDWVIMDLRRRRLTRIPDFVAALHPEHAPLALERDKERPPSPRAGLELASFKAGAEDMDRNSHVNNVRLTEWVLRSLPAAYAGRFLRALHIIYRAEALLGDELTALGAPGELQGEFLHSLCRASDGQELVRARSLWN